MRKYLTAVISIGICLSLVLAGCGRGDTEKGTVVWHTSDIHYIAPELIEDRSAFEEMMLNADGKATQYIEEITDAFIDEALEAKPDAIIISGDLSMNGAAASHEKLAEKLALLRQAGIKVLVIPGNHDLSREAYRFTVDGVEGVEGTTAEQFRNIYFDCGFSEAVSEDTGTLSYTAQIGEGLRVLMLDVNSALAGTVPDGTLKWVEEQLAAAEKDGCRMITVSHQNLFIHNPLFSFGYQINNSARLTALYEKYGVALNLSGHLHIQHIACENGIAEIDASSLAVSPNQYGILNFGDMLEYHTQKTDVKVEGIEDFADYSAVFFDSSNSKFSNAIPDGFSEDEKRLMTEFARTMNRGLFSGYIQESDESIMELWSRVQGFSYKYLSSMLPGVGTDYTKAQLALSP